MHVNKEQMFNYHADANALGGHLTQPLPRTVGTRSSVSLAQAGGYGSARAERFNLDGLVSFESAQVSVSGLESREEGGWRSVATASIEGLNVLNVVTADRLVAQVSVIHLRHAQHKDGQRAPGYLRPATISFIGTQFVNLRLNGRPLDPVLDNYLLYGLRKDNSRPPSREAGNCAVEPPACALPDFPELITRAEDTYRQSKEARDNAAELLGSRFGGESPNADLYAKGSARCSLVEGVTAEAPATSFRHAISVPDFGNIFLGEIRLTQVSAQLTMLRVEMGCIARGQLSAATAFSNGSTMP